jgi:adenylosuccinate synthase
MMLYLKMQKNIFMLLEDFIGAKISSISTSPEREDTIF